MPVSLDLSHDLPFSPARYLEIFFDPDFADFVRARAQVSEYKVESLVRSETHVARTIKIVPKVDLPGWLRRVLGGDRIAYLETMSHAIGSNRIEQVILSSVLTERIDIRSTLTLEALPEGGCRRSARASIKVGIYAVGPRVEEQLLEIFRKGYAQGRDHMVEYDALAARRAAGA